MSFSLSILLESILCADLFVHQVLTIHRFDGSIRSVEIVVGDEPVTFGFACLGIAGDLWSGVALTRLVHIE